MDNNVIDYKLKEDVELTNTSAWILHIKDDNKIAVSQYEMSHIVESPVLMKLPKAPDWCSELMIWKGQAIPVFDFFNSTNNSSIVSISQNILIVAIIRCFEKSSKRFKYGAIKITRPPILEKVSNGQASPLNSLNKKLKYVAISGFYDSEKSEVAILNIESLLSKAL